MRPLSAALLRPGNDKRTDTHAFDRLFDNSIVPTFLRSDGTINQQAGHAWAEAYVPNLGWVGFDAANGICTTDTHARVAIGLDYLGAAPVRGTRYGGGTETLTVAVRVEQAGRPGQWQSQQ